MVFVSTCAVVPFIVLLYHGLRLHLPKTNCLSCGNKDRAKLFAALHLGSGNMSHILGLLNSESVNTTGPLTDSTDWRPMLRYLTSIREGENNLNVNCRDVFSGISLEAVSEMFAKRVNTFSKRLHEAMQNSTFLEGHVGQLGEQMVLYYQMAKEPFVSNICEIGFNAGHSALVWLTSNPTANVYSFDLGEHVYSRTMAEFLTGEFPGRLTVTFGDSKTTVPAFFKRGIKCDIVVIDGCHTFETAKTDLENMRNYVSRERHILLFDDYPSKMSNFMQVLGRVWREAKEMNKVSELFNCIYQPGEYRGFTIGTYVFDV